jgi:hypothetical protein
LGPRIECEHIGVCEHHVDPGIARIVLWFEDLATLNAVPVGLESRC